MNHKSKLSKDEIAQKLAEKKWLAVLCAIFIYAFLILLSWGIFTGFMAIICLCFGIKISLRIITGGYVLILLIKFVFDANKKA